MAGAEILLKGETSGEVIIKPKAIAGTKTITVMPTRDLSKEIKIADYSITTGDEGKMIVLGPLNAAAREFTLPSVGSADDGLVVRIGNDSYYNLVIKVSDTDHIWNSGDGYGIELPEKGTSVVLRYNHADTKWDILSKTGGRVLVEGLKLHEPMNRMYSRDVDVSTSRLQVFDRTNKHIGTINEGVGQLDSTNSVFAPGCFTFDGSNEFIDYPDSSDWDIVKDINGSKTVACWVYNGSGDAGYVSQIESSTENWRFRRTGSGLLAFNVTTGGVETVDIADTSALSDSTWYHIALIIQNENIGIYVDGVQVAYADLTAHVDSYAGELYIGRANTVYFDGYMQDLHLSYNNPYNATPNVGLTDSFTVPAGPFQGVML